MTKHWALIVHCTAWSILLMLVGIFLFALVFLSLRWQQTECQCVTLSPVSRVTLVSFSPDIQSKYLVTISLRNKLPGWLCCFKKLARGPGKRKREMFVAMYVSVCLCHCWGPFSSMSPAKLACHLSPWSHIVLRQPLQSGQKKGKGGSFNQYFRNQKPPQLVLCWANNNSFISFPMIRNSSLSVAIYFWLLSVISGEALTECRIFCKCINKYLYLI